MTVPQAGGVVPGPRLATPENTQEETQHHHRPRPLTLNIDRHYLSLNTPDISSFNNLCS